MYKRDYSNFSEDSFRDVSIQNFNNYFENVDDKFNNFYFKLEGCVERHAPLERVISNVRNDKQIMKTIIRDFTIFSEMELSENLKNLL